MRLSLILPTLDERENLAVLLPELCAGLPSLGEILVVDDGSTDGTRELCARLARDDARIRLIGRSGPPSLTASIRDGIRAATGEVVGWMDADGACAVDDYRRIVEAVEGGADVAVGSRFAAGGRIKGQSADGSLGRLAALREVRASHDAPLGVALSFALNVIVLPLVLGDGVHDYTSGIVAGRRDTLLSLPIEGDHGEYCIGLIAEARARGLAFVEIGYHVHPRRRGRSKTAPSLGRLGSRGLRYLAAGVRARRAGR